MNKYKLHVITTINTEPHEHILTVTAENVNKAHIWALKMIERMKDRFAKIEYYIENDEE